ncbi:MAG: NUDIX hydrolase [Planctomycetota bacterium]
MKFCSDCGGALVDRVPPGDDRTRRWCDACEKAHYQNPLVVVGCLVARGDEILLCRRAIEPAHGKWTVPAGFLELGETLAAGAARETFEEAGARVEIVAPHSLLDLTHIGQHYAMFRARLTSPEIEAGVESLECAFFPLDDLPWRELAFPAVHFALRLLLDDRAAATTHVHHGQLHWTGEGSRFDAANYVIEEHLRTPLA